MRKGWFKKAKRKWYDKKILDWAFFVKPEEYLIVTCGMFELAHYEAFNAYRSLCIKHPERFIIKVLTKNKK